MQLTRFVTPLTLCLLMPLAGCSQGGTQTAAVAAQAPAAVTADGRKLRPLTDIEIAQDAYSKGDYPKALDHFRAAATAGDADAMYYTGVMYAEAEGVAKKSLPEAIRWYEKAAARDQPDALCAMARLYVVGDGVDRDPNKAVEYFDRAIKAYPPGPKQDSASQQRVALAAVLDQQKTAAATTPQKN
ncbi:MAG: tetratricopeptide repeat protein [Gammaproteobacteria bacterium]